MATFSFHADLFVRVFNVTGEGNFPEGGRGSNILHTVKTKKELSSELKVTEKALEERVDKAREKLFKVREERIHPYKDDKILTDWNGLMIAALAKGSRAFGEEEFAGAAEKAADFILDKMRTPDGRLLHRYRGGEAGIRAHIDDYAFFVWGLLELFEATFKTKYLEAAIDLNDDMIEHFWDKNGKGFFSTADDGEALIVRQKDIYDGAIPSGNSVAMLNLVRLGRLMSRSDLEEKASAIGRAFSGSVGKYPAGYTQFMSGVDFLVGPSFEVVIAGPSNGKDTKKLLAFLAKDYTPNKVVIFRPTDIKAPQITSLAPFIKYYEGIKGKATAYVCRDYNCNLPTTDGDKMIELLRAGRTEGER